MNRNAFLKDTVNQALAAFIAADLAINPETWGWQNQVILGMPDKPLFLAVIPYAAGIIVLLGEPDHTYDADGFYGNGWRVGISTIEKRLQLARVESTPVAFRDLDIGAIMHVLARCRIEIPNLDLNNLPDFDVELAAVPWLDPDKFLDLVPYLTIKSTPPATVDLTEEFLL